MLLQGDSQSPCKEGSYTYPILIYWYRNERSHNTMVFASASSRETDAKDFVVCGFPKRKPVIYSISSSFTSPSKIAPQCSHSLAYGSTCSLHASQAHDIVQQSPSNKGLDPCVPWHITFLAVFRSIFRFLPSIKRPTITSAIRSVDFIFCHTLEDMIFILCSLLHLDFRYSANSLNLKRIATMHASPISLSDRTIF